MTRTISGLTVGLAILVGALGLGWPENRDAMLHADDNDWDSAHVAPFVLPVTTVVFKTSELLQSADADVRYVVQALDRFFPSLTVSGLD